MSDTNLRPGSDEEWADLLQQLRQQPRAQPRPYFYTRVQARLAAKQRAPILPAWVRRPAYAALLGVLVLAVSSDGAALPPTGPASQPSGHFLNQPGPLAPH